VSVKLGNTNTSALAWAAAISRADRIEGVTTNLRRSRLESDRRRREDLITVQGTRNDDDRIDTPCRRDGISNERLLARVWMAGLINRHKERRKDRFRAPRGPLNWAGPE
jgi:hypothetical protein